MKISILWAMIIALGAAYAGFSFGQRWTPLQLTSQAGQTLTDVSRALLEVKLSKGEYPPSLEGIPLPPDQAGDFSAEIWRHVIYRRTENGYIAFVGIRSVAYIEPDKACNFKFLK